MAERIADVLGRSVPGRILDVLSDAAAELSATLPEGRVDIRVAGDDVDLTYVEDEPGPSAAPTGEGDEQSARISLRLGEGLKARLEAGAAAEGISVNTFIVRTLERHSSDRSRQPGGQSPARLRHDLKERTWRRHSRPREACASPSRSTRGWSS